MSHLQKEVSLYSYSYIYRAPRLEAEYAYGANFSAHLVTSAFRNISGADENVLVRITASTL